MFDPNYSPTTPPQPPDFTPGINTFFGNNGQQTAVTVGGMTQCPGGGGTSPPPGITVVKTGPFASVADANAGTPLIGQTPATFLPDTTTVWYKVVVTNTNNSVPLLLGSLVDNNSFVNGVDSTPPSGFTHTGNTLASWGITCVPSPASEICHELATTAIPSGYNFHFTLGYDPSLHGVNAQVPLAPSATLTYLIPYPRRRTPTNASRLCRSTNTVSGSYVDALGGDRTTSPAS